MIIPNDAFPSWTNRDLSDSNLYGIHRSRLWLCNYCVSLWPQIFSWIVVNIYPASSKIDYRFEDEFANRAILVTIEWHRNGKGCSNSSCYATYPTRSKCSVSDAPLIFPSGNRTTVEACQPACFAKRRVRQLLRTMRRDQSMTDQTNPRKSCPACKVLPEHVAYQTRRWRFTNLFKNIDVFDSRDGQIKSVQHNLDVAKVPYDQVAQPNVDVDTFNTIWDSKYRNCVIKDDFSFRKAVEPPYRNTGDVCNQTNFEIGDDVEWGLRFNEGNNKFMPNYGFAVKHSTQYCRAFSKKLDDTTGDCYDPWWKSLLTYTLIGEGLYNAIHGLVHHNPKCMFRIKVEDGDRKQVEPFYSSQTNYAVWHRDVNTRLVLPPPNVTLSDLGIDVRKTGNRLYWNSVEGIVSQFVMFNTVEELSSTPVIDNFQAHPSQLYNVSRSNLYRDYSGSFQRDEGTPPAADSDDNDDDGDETTVRTSDVDNVHTTADSSSRLAYEEKLKLYRDLLRRKTTLLESRLQNAELKADDDRSSMSSFRDDELDSEIARLWSELRDPIKETLTNEIQSRLSDAKAKRWKGQRFKLRRTRRSVNYGLEAHEYAAQRFVSGMVPDDAKRVMTTMTRSDGGAATGGSRKKRQTDDDSSSGPTIVPSDRLAKLTANRRRNRKNIKATADDPQVNDILDHLDDELSRSRLFEIFRDIGISLSFDFVIIKIIKRLLSAIHGRILLFLSRYAAGTVTLSLLRAGIRVGVSRTVGFAAGRLATQTMVMIGQAATGVGLILDAIALVSFAFDIAQIAGWDPAKFHGYTELTVYYEMAKSFAETLNDIDRGPITALEMMERMYQSNDLLNGAAGEKRDGTVNTPTSNADIKRPTAGDESLHVDERLDEPKWFNRKFVRCFGDEKSRDDEHPLIMNSYLNWNILASLDYLGSLSTNSFGQRIFPDRDTKVRLNDNDIVGLLTELQYRQLLTVTSNADVSNNAYHRRVKASTAGNSLGLALSLGIGSIAVAVTVISQGYSILSGRPSKLLAVPFSLVCPIMIALALFSILYAVITVVPVTASTERANQLGTTVSSPENDTVAKVQVKIDNKDVVDNVTDDYWRLTYYANRLRSFVYVQ